VSATEWSQGAEGTETAGPVDAAVAPPGGSDPAGPEDAGAAAPGATGSEDTAGAETAGSDTPGSETAGADTAESSEGVREGVHAEVSGGDGTGEAPA
jgi:hypothetical protein